MTTDDDFRQRTERLREAYRAFNAKDAEGVLRLMTPDVHWPRAFKGGFVVGTDAVRDYWTEQWREIDGQVEPIALARDGDAAIVCSVQLVVRDLQTGTVQLEQTVGHRYTFDGDRIARMELVDPLGPASSAAADRPS